MLNFYIPGYAELHIEHLVLDYNGTLAIDGVPQADALAVLSELSLLLNIHIVTADTHGSVRSYLQHESISLHILAQDDQSQQKRDYITQLGSSKTAAIGNGYNDCLMLKEAAIGIAVLQEEGLAIQTLTNADLVFSSIIDALNCLRSPTRLMASLRR